MLIVFWSNNPPKMAKRFPFQVRVKPSQRYTDTTYAMRGSFKYSAMHILVTINERAGGIL